MVLRFIIDKYVKNEKRNIYACFFDLRKAFDTVQRAKLFHILLTKYKIGGHFLGIIQSIYTDNLMYVKVKGGLTHPFLTTTGVKQGCVLSPLIFNLFIMGLPEVLRMTIVLIPSY